MSFAEKMKDLETKLADNFVENLTEDINGNIIAGIKEKESVHSINLNFTHKPSRNATTSKIEPIQQLKEKLKESVIKNMAGNIVDENQADTTVEFASAFDMCPWIWMHVLSTSRNCTHCMGQIIFMKFQNLIAIR